MEQIEAAQEKHFYNVDLTFVLGVKDFLKSQPPSWLTGQRAIEIYQEIKELTQKLAEQEFEFDGRKIDLYGEDDEADVIKYKALDTICLKYHLEEEQLKHVLYINFILPNQEETTPVGGGEYVSPPGDSEEIHPENYRTQQQRSRTT